jgi:outer membrane lipoprotein-sorting protein
MKYSVTRHAPMKLRTSMLLLAISMALLVPVGAWAQTLDEAARQAAKQHNAKVLSAQTVQEGQKRVHVIKLLTKDGVVKTVRIPVRDS